MRCLIINNYDSFTWNLADYVAQIFGEDPLVVRNDEYSWHELKDRGGFSSIIVSPGPGSVVNEADFHISLQALEQNEFPVLGVCLGFQGLAYVYGGRIMHAPVPFHGRRSTVINTGDGLFEGIPQRFEAVRYHSLMVCQQSLPPVLKVTARTDCGVVMGLQHVQHPKWGVQFHPESILTEHGKRIVANFAKLAARHSAPLLAGSEQAGKALSVCAPEMATPRVRRMLSRKIKCRWQAEDVFLALFAAEKHCFWLDSQLVCSPMARYSFMGAVNESEVVRHCVRPGSMVQEAGERFLAEMDRALQSVLTEDVAERPPFAFRGGYVGYMSYEMKSVFGAPASHANAIPDALWMRVERFVAFDHATEEVWLLALADTEDLSALAWLDAIEQRIHAIGQAAPACISLGLRSMEIELNHGRRGYLEAIERCKQRIVDGESYEICLTDLFSFQAELDPLMLYRYMRRGNPAPFGAYLRNGSDCILSTSPERFLEVDGHGTIQTKPIKGTCRRAEDPQLDRNLAMRLAASEKDRAENLMIVDLMRNDLSRVAVPGSVTVPKLMDIESYKTVHQMVSTVEARLRADCSLVDLLKAVFPGGSITGAPKLRSMEIIDGLENAPRGVYCGSIGYLGYNCVADLNIAIRSLSYDGQEIRFGAGGAITFLSDPQDEFDEVLLKAEAILKPIWHYLHAPNTPLHYELREDKLLLAEHCVSEMPARQAFIEP
ncbi:aminodeoxychorismate synthase component I [Xanthomonas albilineans]|uniref:aminodeoxychorismate synthase component I n=1 Tax=Xanthomonas albilineans TaxID=29447 RepID=UPI000696E53B|nr:aminodeoxychorismate synthase component I [Xanthomonas albilineans]